jgi:hypothetical protein
MSAFLLPKGAQPRTASGLGCAKTRPYPEDVPPRRVTPRFLTQPPGSADGARRPFNSLQVLRRRATRRSAHHHPLAKRRCLQCSRPETYPGQSSPSVARETPSSSFNVKTPSSRVFWALSFKSLLIGMAHLRGGHSRLKQSVRGVPYSHSPANDTRCSRGPN